MRIKIWGCRGSLTTPGREVVRYGGNTTCLEVRLDDGTLVIVDSGSGIHKLGSGLLGEKGLTEMYLLLTHSHWDHLTGFPFFTPAYLPAYTIRVKGGPDAKNSLRKYLEHQMDPPYFPVEFNVLRASFDFSSDDTQRIRVGSAEVVPIPLNHPNGGYGFVFVEKRKRFVFLTDNELGFPHPGGLRDVDYTSVAKGADLLFHDAQYSDDEYATRSRGWGHSTYTTAAALAATAGVRRFGTFHHDPDHSDEEIDASIRRVRSVIAERGARMECFAVAEGMELSV
jgi:phosphoribosyl 1,2-cyclic phosphodiesterase